MAYDLQGTLFEVFDTQQVTDKFKKREFVVETTSGMYNEYIKMQAVQERCELLDTMKKGDTIKVSFDLRGKLVNTRDGRQVYITNINAWKIEKLAGSMMSAQQDSSNAYEQQSAMPAPGDYDDVPF